MNNPTEEIQTAGINRHSTLILHEIQVIFYRTRIISHLSDFRSNKKALFHFINIYSCSSYLQVYTLSTHTSIDNNARLC